MFSDNQHLTPNEITLRTGETLRIECNSSIPVKWRLFAYGTVRTLKNSIVITNVKELNRGIYECMGETYSQEKFIAEAYVHIEGNYLK